MSKKKKYSNYLVEFVDPLTLGWTLGAAAVKLGEVALKKTKEKLLGLSSSPSSSSKPSSSFDDKSSEKAEQKSTTTSGTNVWTEFENSSAFKDLNLNQIYVYVYLKNNKNNYMYNRIKNNDFWKTFSEQMKVLINKNGNQEVKKIYPTVDEAIHKENLSKLSSFFTTNNKETTAIKVETDIIEYLNKVPKDIK